MSGVLKLRVFNKPEYSDSPRRHQSLISSSIRVRGRNPTLEPLSTFHHYAANDTPYDEECKGQPAIEATDRKRAIRGQAPDKQRCRNARGYDTTLGPPEFRDQQNREQKCEQSTLVQIKCVTNSADGQ